MKTRTHRVAVALVLLVVAWPALGDAVASLVGWVFACPSLVITLVAVVLLLSTDNGRVVRTATRIAGARRARSATGGAA